MGFIQIVKNVDTNNCYFDNINLYDVKAQYNPERFCFWKSLHEGPKKEVLNMLYSPHYRFLKDRKNKAYYQLQRFYGRNGKWIKNKINKFLDVFENIKQYGFSGEIIILEKPLVNNKYNYSYEIFEGHHRVACCLVLGMKIVPCQIVRR
jgi:hypothetical protein